MQDLAAIKGKDVVVIGANGFLGRPLTNRLVAAGANVVGVCRNPPSTGAENISWWRGDVTELSCVTEMFYLFRPAVVFQLTSDNQGGRALSLIPSSVQNDMIATINVLHGAASADFES